MTAPYTRAWFLSVIGIGLVGMVLAAVTGPAEAADFHSYWSDIFPISGTAIVLAIMVGIGIALACVMAWDHFKKDDS